jgi:hypothetical protein
MKDDVESDSSAAKPKPFLLGGSGWARQVAALHSGGRYVPKGGFVVDFTSRGKYSSEINRKWGGGSNDDEQSSDLFGSGSGSSSAGESESWADRIVLRHTQDVLYELSPPQKSGVSPTNLHGQKLATINEERASSPFLVQKEEEPSPAAVKQRQSNTAIKPSLQQFQPEKQNWRPPGPCTPPRSSAGTAASALYQRRSVPNYGKKKQNGKRSSTAASAPPHDCTKCECCLQIRQTLEETEAASRQDKAAAAHLRRRLEQEMAKLTKERRDFEAFKVNKMNKIALRKVKYTISN